MVSLAQEKKEEPKNIDPLNRTTPRSSITGFLRAAERGNYATAARYLDIQERSRASLGVTMARELQAIMNDGYDSPLGLISDQLEGSDEEGLAPNKERLGKITIGESSVDLILTRVEDPEAGPVWVVSSETLAKVPTLSRQIRAVVLVDAIPEELQKRVLGLEIWQWIGIVALLFVAYGIAQLITYLVRKMLQRTRWNVIEIPRSILLLLAIFIHARLVAYLELPVLYRSYYARVTAALFILGMAWLLSQAIDRLAENFRSRAVSSGRLATGSWVIIGQRILKVMLFASVVLIFLGWMGFNLSAALAGVGIGGIAIGFGAQKTIENLFGGLSVASDKVIRVGDTCNFGGKVGSVTDIGLRSTRMRTTERTELSIPNGVLATMQVENLSMRDKLLFQTTLGLRYETTQEQLETILKEIRELLGADRRIEQSSLRVRFINYGETALQVEIFSYVLTADFGKFAEAREEILLSIMKIVQGAGTNFSFPTPTSIYVEDKRSGHVEGKQSGSSAGGAVN